MKTKKLLAVLLVVMMVLSMGSMSALANDSGNRKAIIVGEVLGRPEDQDGFLLDDSNMIAPFKVGALFTMTATNVSSLITTSGVSGKSFTGGAMDALKGEGLKISGKVTSTEGTGSRYGVKVGACYVNPSNGTFISATYSYFNSGSNDNAWFEKTYFSNSITYFGHITNDIGSGTVSGSLDFSVTLS